MAKPSQFLEYKFACRYQIASERNNKFDLDSILAGTTPIVGKL